MMELLAPAGSLEAFEAAVKAGADAVYIGGSAFNARQYADNFNDGNLKYALDYAHLRGVKVYITVNTLVRDDEFKTLVPYLEMLYESGADGIIVQDIGVAALIRQYLPDMPLHASTQMTVHNSEGAAALKLLGFKRIVPARELSLDEVADLADIDGLEIEVFVHGAMCYSYSGQCLMSSFMGGRSGNRGRCAQPCRMAYSLVREGSRISSSQHLLSMKDMCLIDELHVLSEAGVSALKIEGRMKSPEYVAIVVSKYRKALDRMETGINPLADEQDKMQLMQVFNRGGFSKGYIYGKSGINMICPEKPDNWGVPLGCIKSYDAHRNMANIKLEAPLALGDGIEIRQSDKSTGQIVTYMEDVNGPIKEAPAGRYILVRINSPAPQGTAIYKTLDTNLDKKIKAYIKKAERYIGLKAEVNLIEGKPPSIEVWDSDGNNVKCTGTEIVQSARNAALQKERVIEQIKRVGDLPFNFNNIDVNISPNAWIPISVLNALRRSAIEELVNRRIDKKHRQPVVIESHMPPIPYMQQSYKCKKPAIFVMLDNLSLVSSAIQAGADGIYLHISAKEATGANTAQIARLCKDAGIELIWVFPRVTRNIRFSAIREALLYIQKLYSGVLVSDIGQLNCAKVAGIAEIYGDYSLNIFNSNAVQTYAKMGIKRFMPSLELTLSQIKELHTSIPMELMAHGNIPLMVAEGCPIGSVCNNFNLSHSCSRPCLKQHYSLRDRKGELLPIRTYVDKYGCHIEIENAHQMYMADKIDDLLSAKPYSLRLNLNGYDSNELMRTVKIYKQAIDKQGEITQCTFGKITRGHYYNGVD